MLPIGGNGNEGDELASDLVDDDVSWIFASGFAGYYCCGWNADQSDDDGCDDRADG
jgi:hypothetical protein